MKSEEETGNLLKPGLVRRMLASHSEMGLVLAVLIYMVCVTGTITAMLPQLALWEKPVAENAEISDAALERGIVGAVAQVRASPILALKLELHPLQTPEPGPSNTIINITTKTGDKNWLVAPNGDLVVQTVNSQPADVNMAVMPDFTAFVRGFHANLTVPGYNGFGLGGAIGGILVGLSGIALLALIITGILAHPQIFRDAFHLRWGGSKRLQEVDMHNRLGVWGLPFGLAITVSGIFVTLAVAILVPLTAITQHGGDVKKTFKAATNGFTGASPDDPQAAAPNFVSGMISALNFVKKQPGVDATLLIRVTDPGTPMQSLTVGAHIKNSIAAVETFSFDSAGKFIKRGGFTDGPLGLRLSGVLTGIHFGNFGGLFSRLLYLLLGAGLCLSTTSGVRIWLIRNRDQRNPRPGWERIWCTTVWGVLIALSVSALVALVVSTSLVPVFWGTFAALFVLPARMRNVDRLSKILRGLLAACLVSIVLVHIGVNGAAAFAITPLAINISLLVLGGILTGSMFNYLPLQRRPERVAG